MRKNLLDDCRSLLAAYKTGKLGQTRMPEDSNPGFGEHDSEARVAYFTLPMALNYQRDSYKLWEAALKTYLDPKTRFVFDASVVAGKSEREVREALLKHKLALQPNKHIATWMTIAKTIKGNWGSFVGFIESTQNDFLELKRIVQIEHKKGFPYLSGPKIFNYWSFILGTYAGANLSHREFIEIAPDTHITQCSVRLGVITSEETETLTKDQISFRWRELLRGGGIDPIDMHPPLWFWSKNGFIYELS